MIWIVDFNNRERMGRRKGAELYYFISRDQVGNINKWSINREWWACGDPKMHAHFKAFKTNVFQKALHKPNTISLSAKSGSWTINLQPSCCNPTLISWTQASFWLVKDEGLRVLFISWFPPFWCHFCHFSHCYNMNLKSQVFTTQYYLDQIILNAY